jgi:transaldolase
MKKLFRDLESIGLVDVAFTTRGKDNEHTILYYYDTNTTLFTLSDEINLYEDIIKENKLEFTTEQKALISECKLLELHKIAMTEWYNTEGLANFGSDWEQMRDSELVQIELIKTTIQKHII